LPRRQFKINVLILKTFYILQLLTNTTSFPKYILPEIKSVLFSYTILHIEIISWKLKFNIDIWYRKCVKENSFNNCRIINWEIYAFHWDTYQQLASLQWSFWRLKTWRRWTSAVFQIHTLKSRWCRTAKDWRRRKRRLRSVLLIHITTNHSPSRFLLSKYKYENILLFLNI